MPVSINQIAKYKTICHIFCDFNLLTPMSSCLTLCLTNITSNILPITYNTTPYVSNLKLHREDRIWLYVGSSSIYIWEKHNTTAIRQTMPVRSNIINMLNLLYIIPFWMFQKSTASTISETVDQPDSHGEKPPNQPTQQCTSPTSTTQPQSTDSKNNSET